MATKFKKDQVVSVNAVIPQGPVKKVKMDEDGNVFYLVSWKDVAGEIQERWFPETELIEA